MNQLEGETSNNATSINDLMRQKTKWNYNAVMNIITPGQTKLDNFVRHMQKFDRLIGVGEYCHDQVNYVHFNYIHLKTS